MRKMGIGIAALAATSLLLAGCAAGGTPAPTATTPAETEDPAVDFSGITLTIWTDANREPAIAAAAKTFEDETGGEIELVQKNFDDIRTDFTNQVPTGEGPDITIGAHDWVGGFVQDGVISPVDVGDAAGSFEQVSLDAFSYDGQLYALPYALETLALIQNVDLVGEDAPATWEDMIAAGEASDAERPFVINTNGQTGDGYTMYGFQTSFGAPVFVQDASGSYTSEVGMGGDAGTAFADWLGANGEKGDGYISTTIDYDTNNELFASGKAAFTVQGPWAIAALTAEGANVKVNPIPSAGGQPAGAFVGVQGFYVSSQSKNALVAQEFLTKYIATYDAQKALFEADPRISAWKDVAAEVTDPVIAGFTESAKSGVPMPSIPEMGSVWDLWNAAQVQVIKGADPESTWNKMVSDLEALIG